MLRIAGGAAMKKAEEQNTMAAMVPMDESADDLTLLDRSTLQDWATCPAMAAHKAAGSLPVAQIAEVGVEVHSAFGRALTEHVMSGGALNVRELINTLTGELQSSRPDVQPEVIKAARSSVWAWVKHIEAIHPENILRYDGGEGKRSGQLSWDLPSLGCRVTSEIDLLHAGPSPECLHEHDYKTGHKQWTDADVKNAFQFRLHGWLIFNNYPDVNGSRVRVWNTRLNVSTYAVELKRKWMADYSTQVAHVAGIWYEHRDKKPEDCPTWPTIEKCSQCDAASLCPASGQAITELADDPGAYVDRMVAIEGQLEGMKKLATKFIDNAGLDIVSPTGNVFGRDKPTADRKSKVSLYREPPPASEDGHIKD